MDLRVNYVFGQDLRAERRRRLLTQEEAAKQVGVSTRTWQGWELNGITAPRMKHQRALIAWLAEPDDEVAA